MTEFRVEVVTVGAIEKHPNADSLSITSVNGYPCILRTGDFEAGQTAVYVPIDSVVPAEPRWEFLGDHRRIKAKRLRGVFSMGLLTAADSAWIVGQNVQAELKIEKYEPPIERISTGGNAERDPGCMPFYTDIEGLRRWPLAIEPDEEVVLTEKVHGANFRACWFEDRLWVGSRGQMKVEEETSIWWRVAKAHGLADVLRARPDLIVYGEVYGAVQDLRYGTSPGEVKLALFDVFDRGLGRYADYDSARASMADLPWVPVLYRGPWSGVDRQALSNGKSTIADHCREGFVVRPVLERWDMKLGRVVLKMVGEDYLLRKGAA